MKFLIIFICLFLTFSVYGIDAIGVFTSNADSSRLTNADTLEGQWIYVGFPYEGSATLFVSGDSISGTTPTVTVLYQQMIGISSTGDTLLSEIFTLGTVAATLLKKTIGNGNLIGETFILGNDAEWTNKQRVKFFFLGSGTHATDIISVFKRGK